MKPWGATKVSPLFLLAGLGLGGYLAVWRNKRALEVRTGSQTSTERSQKTEIEM